MKEKFYSMLGFLALMACVCTFTACGSDSKNDDEGGGGGGGDATSIVGSWYIQLDISDFGGYVDDAYGILIFKSNTYEAWQLYNAMGQWVKTKIESDSYSIKGDKIVNPNGEEIPFSISGGKLMVRGMTYQKLSGSVKSHFDSAYNAEDY